MGTLLKLRRLHRDTDRRLTGSARVKPASAAAAGGARVQLHLGRVALMFQALPFLGEQVEERGSVPGYSPLSALVEWLLQSWSGTR